IALVKNGKCGGERRIAQILVKLWKLPGCEQALVHDGLGGERADVTSWRQERFRPFSQKSQTPFKSRHSPPRMEWFDEKLPNLGHRFKRAAAQRIGIHRHAAPSDDAEALGACGGFHGGAGLVDDGGRKKGKANREHFGQVNSLLLRAGAEKGLRERSEQAGAVAAGSIRVDSSAVGEALQSCQSKLDNVIAGSPTEAGNETCTAGVVVWVAPVGVTTPSRPGSRILMTGLASTVPAAHTSLLNGRGVEVQRRILIL